MHYLAEVYLKSADNWQEQIKKIMNAYDENENEHGFLDYWLIGGRWTGHHVKYDPYSDPALKEKCWLCNGTGMRNDALGIATRFEQPGYTCNGCHGTGKKTVVESKFPIHPKDIIPVSELDDNYICYTFIAPEYEIVMHKDIWTGKDWIKNASFDGKIKPILERCNITDGYLVTVDYHD